MTNEGSSLLLYNFINYLNGNRNNSIWLMTKGYDTENNIDIKEDPVQVTKGVRSLKILSLTQIAL